MKKSKILNIALTTVMLLSTVLTPQMSHALADMQTEDAERTSEVEETDVDVIKEESTDDTNDNSGDGDSAEVVEMDSENEPEDAEDDPAPVEDDEVVSEEPEDVKATSPPVEEKNEVSATSLNIAPMADLGNIFTFESLKIDGDDISDGDIIEIKEGALAELSFAWNTEGRNAKAGDTASIQLSDAFEIVTTSVEDLIVKGTNVGTYHVENGILLFNFNEGIEQDDVHNGWVDLNLEFNLDKFRENIEQEIPFHDGSDQNITVVAKPNLDHSGIEKEGHPDTQHDAREITWTIDVINTNEKEITEATLADKIPDGLGEARDFVIHELDVDFDGKVHKGTDVTSMLNPSGFPLEFDTIAPFNGYRVQYTTPIENYAAESFTNDATFKYGDATLPADATVGRLTRSNPIEKNGWQVGDNDLIHWQIDVNKNGSLISEAIVADELPAGLTIDPDSIEVVRITQSGNNWIEGDPHETPFTKFPMDLGTLGQEDAYRIKFETNVNWEDINKGNYQQNNGFKNETTLFDGEDELNDDDAIVDIVRGPILRKAGASNVDYNNKTVTWTIHVNEAGHPIGNVVLTDLIPEGLAITEDDINITDEEGNDYTPTSIKLDPDADGGTEVVINLGDVGTRQLKVEYTTEITDFTINNFNNGVGMTGDGIGPDGENSNATIRPEGNVYGKSFEGIDYNAKTIDWQLNVNPKREAINSLIIEDSFPNKGLILLPGTVEVNFAGDKLEEGTDYTLEPRTRTEDRETGYHKGFKITILNNALPLDGGQLIVDYQTSYDPQKDVNGNTLDSHEPNVGDDNDNTDRLYVNRVQYTGETVNNNDIDQTRDASQRVREDSWNSGKKEGQLVHFDDEDNVVNGWVSGSERKIAWQFYFNYQEQNLGTGVVVTDELAYAGDIDADSIQVSIYDVKSDGETRIKPDTVLDPSNYSVDTDEAGRFILTFKDDFAVTERYVVTFTTSVPDISKENYTNNATVTVGDRDYEYSETLNYNEHDEFLDKSAIDLEGNRVFTGDEVDWQATVNESLSIIKNAVITDTISAGHVYLEESLEVHKAQDLKNPLETEKDYTLEVKPVTDENDDPTGETNLVITMTEDLKDTLVLKYKTVVTETDGQIGNSISLDGTAIEREFVNSDQLNARQFSDAGGQWAPTRGAIRLTKVDAEEEAIIENNEATFQLWYELNGGKQRFGEEEYTTENGVLEIGNLPFRTYYLKEVTAPNGYVKSDEDLEIVVDTAIGNDQDNPIFEEATFENTKEKIDVTGTKVWVYGSEENRPTIQLQLYRNDSPYGEAVTLENGETEYKWTDLDKTNIDGEPYVYTVDEIDVPENYEKVAEGLKVTNTYVSPKTDITGEKIWIDGPEERPTIDLQLYRNGEAFGDPVPLVNGETEYTWTDLDLTDRHGVNYEYTVDEVNVPENYKKSAEGLEVTNTYVSPKTDITGEKIWIYGPEERPTIDLQLYRNGEAFGDPVPLVNGENEYTWTDLDLTDNQGVNYEYTVDEVNVPENYKKSAEGLEVTNTYEIPTDGTATATKVWEGGPENRPTVWFKLYRQIEDGPIEEVDVDILELTNGTTEVEWTGLEETDIDGNPYTFSVKEVDAEGNDFEPTNYSKTEDGLTVTNEYVIPTEGSAKATKEWVDGPSEHPTTWFKLFRQVEDGEIEEVPEAEVKELANGTTEVEWTGLEETDFDGNVYTFFVKEVNKDGDDSTPENYEKAENGLEVTNYYVSPTDASAKAIKTWENGPQERPTVWFKLFRQIEDGELEEVPEAEIKELSSGTTEVVWNNLTKTDENANEYIFSVKEVDAEGNDFTPESYSKSEEGLNVINTYVIPETEVTGNKIWIDGEEVKPTIELQLYRDGKPFGEPVSLENGVTEYTWSGLDKTDINGNVYKYTIDEVKVPENYEKAISEDGLTVTNTHIPEDPGKETPEDPKDSEESDDDSDLPKTGEAASYTLLALILVGLGFGLRYYSKRRTN